MRKRFGIGLLVLVLAALWVAGGTAGAQEEALSVDASGVFLTGLPRALSVTLPEGDYPPEVPCRIVVGTDGAELFAGTVATVDADGSALRELHLPVVRIAESGEHLLRIEVADHRVEQEVRAIPGWLSILPPLVAILLAIVFRQVVLALASGVWLGALFVNGYDPLTALVRTADTYAVGALADEGHASIVIFSLLLGGMIGVITRSGGGIGLAHLVTRRATTSSKGLLSTWILGLLVFFDDYANSLLVGSTMRPITDRLRVSREKLAFLVDATAAPVSSLALISSWIGVEVGYIADQFAALDIEGDAYLVFIETIPYRFYPLLMLFFGLALVVSKRDWGPMLRAELRARKTGQVLAEGARPAADFEPEKPRDGAAAPSWVNAIVPILIVVVVAVVGMYLDGRAAVLAEDATAELSLRAIFGSCDSLKALLWASLLGSVAAIVVSVGRKSLSLTETLDAWLVGIKSMVLAVIILILAWALGAVCRDELHTAQWVIGAIGEWITPALLPGIVFVVAALVSFATGTSWGTMAILFPLVVPMAHELAPAEPIIMLGGISSILAGSVWGDHCSPISDTTIMSSMASSCDHVDHVRTQIPYALAVGLVSLVLGDLATGFGLYPAWVGLLLGAGVLVLMIRFLGKPVPEHAPERGA